MTPLRKSGKNPAQFVIMRNTLLKENGYIQDEVSILIDKCNSLLTEEEFLNGTVKHIT